MKVSKRLVSPIIGEGLAIDTYAVNPNSTAKIIFHIAQLVLEKRIVALGTVKRK
jgi:hypothetical protein